VETGFRRLRDLLSDTFTEIAGICTWPFRRIRDWRVQRHLQQRLEVFAGLDGFSREETERLRPALVEHERALSRTDVLQEFSSAPTFIPHLLLVFAVWVIFDQAFQDAADYHATALTLFVPILAYLATLAFAWRLIRRVLPPTTFAVVGSRNYHQQIWRLLASIVLVFTLGFLGYVIQGWGLDIKSDWYYLVLYAGGGLALGTVIAATWIVLRLLSTVVQWLLEYVETFTHPEAVLVDNHLAMLDEFQRLAADDETLATNPASKRRLIDMLEMSARCIEQGLRRDLRGLDPETDQWVRTRTSEMAAAMRAMKKDVINSEPVTQAKLYSQASAGFERAVLGEWNQLPLVQDAAYQGDSSRSLALRIVVSLVLIALPLALVIPSALKSDAGDKTATAEEAVDAPAPEGTAVGGSRKTAADIRDGARDWDANLQLIAGILASIILLMSRMDDLATRFSRHRSHPQGVTAGTG
jgi:hypothetical protein